MMESSKGKSWGITRISNVHKFLLVRNNPINHILFWKPWFWTFWKTTSWYPKKQQKQQTQHFAWYPHIAKIALFHIMAWQKLTGPNYWPQSYSKRVSMSINRWPMLFGRYLAGNSKFWHIYVRKKFFWGQKIQKNRFSKNRSKSHIYVKIW